MIPAANPSPTNAGSPDQDQQPAPERTSLIKLGSTGHRAALMVTHSCQLRHLCAIMEQTAESPVDVETQRGALWPPPASSATQRHRPQDGPMNTHEPDNRSGWSFLGFLRSVLGDGPSFWRLFALVLLLIFGYALAKGDVTALYDHLTQHATVWEKWGIPPGGIVIFFGARKYFIYRQAARARRAMEATAAAEKPKKAKKRKP